MEEDTLDINFQPEFIGREEEFKKLGDMFEEAKRGDGSTVFIAGEAGIGKTRLVNELINRAENEGAKIIQSRCLTTSLEPLMPLKTGLREADLYHLISEEPPPKALAAYLINDAGILVAKAERVGTDTDIDHDIFSSMLKTIQDFVKDSLSMMGRDETGELNSIGYGDYNILIQSLGGISLATVIEGPKSEFLIDDMKEKLSGKSEELKNWRGDTSKVEDIESEMQWFIESGKYDGEYLVDDPKIKQENLFDNVLLGLQRLSTEQPVLLFLDDLQWADPSSVKLIHYLSRNTKDDSVLLIGTYRPEDIVGSSDGETHQFKTTLQEMNREGLFERIELERLDESDVEELIRETLGKIELKDELVKKLYQECEGNPFFLLELLHNLVEEGHLEKEEEVWKAEETLEELHIPSKVHDLVVRRLDRLMEEQRELLECASVVGEEFESEVLGEVMEMKKVKLLKNLNEIERTHNLIRSIEKKYRFDHSKIREVLYNGLNKELQKEYHRIVAESYEELYEDVKGVWEKIGQHYYKANDERAGKYLLKAGDHAKKRYANEEAETLYQYSIDILEDEKGLKEAYEALADVHKVMGKYDDAFSEYEKALGLVEEKGEKAGLYGNLAKIYEEKGEFDKCLEICEKGLELVEEDLGKEEANEPPDAEYKLRLLDIKGWVFLRKGEYERAEGIWSESVKIAEKVGDDKEIAQALHDIGSLYIRRGEFDKALEKLDEALQIRDDIGDEKGQAKSLNNIGTVYYFKGELDKSLGYHEDCLKINRKLGDKRSIAGSLNNIGTVYHEKGELNRSLEQHKGSLEINKKFGEKLGIGMSLNNIGMIYQDKGEFEKSLKHLEESLEIRREIGDKRGIASTLNSLGSVYHEKGKFDKSLEHLEESLKIRKDIGDKEGIATSLSYIAKVYRHKGHLEKSREYIDESLDISLETEIKWLSIENFCELAEILMEQKKHDAALQKAERAVELSTEMNAWKKEGLSRRVLGMIYRKKGDLERAKKEQNEAEELLEEACLKIELPKVKYEQALLFVESGDVKKGEKYLNEALETFRRMDMEFWAEKCEKTLNNLDDDQYT